MDVELVEQHHPLILQIVEWPLLRLAIRRAVSAERRITRLCELYPHFAHGLAEGLVEGSARVGSHLGMIQLILGINLSTNNALICQQYHTQRHAFSHWNGEPHALWSDENGHQDECRYKEYQTSKQHA